MAAAASKGETIVIGKEGIMPISDRDNLIRLLSDAVKDKIPQYVLRDLNLFDYMNRSSFDWYGLGANRMKQLVKKLFEDKRYGFDVETKQLPFRQEVGTRKAVVGLGLQLPRVTEVFFDAGCSPERQVDTFGKPLNVVITFGTYIDPGRKPSYWSNKNVNFVIWPRIGDTIDIPQTTFDAIGIPDTTLTATLLRKTYSDTHWNYSIESHDWLGGQDADIKHDGTSPDPNMKTYFAGNETKKQKKEEGDYYGTTEKWEVEMYKHILAKELGDTVQVMLYAAWANRHPDREAIFLTQDILCFLLCLYYRKACLVGGPLGDFGTNLPIDQIPASVRSGYPHTALWYVPTRDPLSRAKLEYRSTLASIAANNKLVIDSVRKTMLSGWYYSNFKIGSKIIDKAYIPIGFWKACLADLIAINKTFEKRSLTPDQLLAKRPTARSEEDRIWALNMHAKTMKHNYHLFTVVAKNDEGRNEIVIGTHWTQQYDYSRPNLDTYVETRLKMIKSMKIDGTMWDEVVLSPNMSNDIPLKEWRQMLSKAYYASTNPKLRTAAYKEGAFENYTPIQSAGGCMQEGGVGEEDEGGELIDFLAPIPPELIQNDGMSISFIKAIQQNQEYLKVPNLVDVVGFPEVDTSPMMYYCDPDVRPGDESYIPGCEGKGEVDLNAMYLSSIGEAVAELSRRYPGANIPTGDDVYWWLYNTSLVYDMDQLIVTADYLEKAFIPHYWNLTPVDIELTDEVAVPAAAAAAPPRAMEVEQPPTPEIRPAARAGMGASAPRGFSPPPESLLLSASALPVTTRSDPASKMRSVRHTRRARATTPRLSTTGKRPQNVLDRAEHALEAIFAGGKKRRRTHRRQRSKSKTKRTGKKRRTTAGRRRRTQRKTRKQEKRR